MEAQVREQTMEAKDYARATCHEINARLRAELDEKVPRFLADSVLDTLATFEAKLLGSLAAHDA